MKKIEKNPTPEIEKSTRRERQPILSLSSTRSLNIIVREFQGEV